MSPLVDIATIGIGPLYHAQLELDIFRSFSFNAQCLPPMRLRVIQMKAPTSKLHAEAKQKIMAS